MQRNELREAILKIAADKQDIVIKPVATPGWPSVDGHVYVRSMSSTGRERYLDSIREVHTAVGQEPTVKVNLEEAGAKLAAATMCNKDGEILFTEADVKILGELSHITLQQVIDVSSELNELDEKAYKRAKNALASVAV